MILVTAWHLLSPYFIYQCTLTANWSIILVYTVVSCVYASSSVCLRSMYNCIYCYCCFILCKILSRTLGYRLFLTDFIQVSASYISCSYHQIITIHTTWTLVCVCWNNLDLFIIIYLFSTFYIQTFKQMQNSWCRWLKRFRQSVS